VRCLTLHPEWAYAFWKLGKDGENRPRPLPPHLIGESIAIHAGASKVLNLSDRSTRDADRHAALDVFRLTCRHAGVRIPTDEEIDAIRGQIVAVVRFDPSIKRSSPWRAGHPLHFYPATSIQPLRTPIAHRGAQGWPFLPPEVEAQVWAAV